MNKKKTDPLKRVRCYQCDTLGQWGESSQGPMCTNCGQLEKDNYCGDTYRLIVKRFLGCDIPAKYDSVLSECQGKCYIPAECAKRIRDLMNNTAKQ